MLEIGHCNFYQWDEEGFELPEIYMLNDTSELADALQVFYLAGGYDFFNVVEPKYYASNWLDFMGNLYCDIADEKYVMKDKCYTIPLTDEQRRDLFERGVPDVFVTDIE